MPKNPSKPSTPPSKDVDWAAARATARAVQTTDKVQARKHEADISRLDKLAGKIDK